MPGPPRWTGRLRLEIETARGLIGAAFTHFTSRAADPQVHTHLVIANMAEGADGRFTALHGTALFEHRRAAGYLYQAVLRHELHRRLGVGFDPVVKGSAEIAGDTPGSPGKSRATTSSVAPSPPEPQPASTPTAASRHTPSPSSSATSETAGSGSPTAR